MSLAGTQDMTMVVRARNLSRAALGQVSGDLARVQGQTSSVATGMATMATIGRRSLIGVGIAAVAGVAASVSSYVGLDAKMTESLAIMGDVNDGMREEMESTARVVGTSTTFSAEEAAEAYFFLASAGFTAEQAVAAMPQVAQFAQAGMFDLALATDLATDAQSALSMTSADAETNLENMIRVTDVLVGANTLANASVEQFSSALINKAAAAGNTANKSIEEITATLAVFADRGFKGNVAGEMYSRMLKGLQINALANTDAFDKHNIAVFDAEGNMRNTAVIVGELTTALEHLSDAEKTQALLDLGFSARQQDVFKVLLGTSEQMAEYESRLNDMSGITEEVADKQLESISNQFALFTSAIKDVFIGLGKELLPVMTKVVKAMASWAQVTLPKVVRVIKLVAKWVGDKLKAAFEAVRTVVRKVIDIWKNLSPEWQRAIKFGAIFTGIILGIAVAVSTLAAAATALYSPWILWIAAIIAVVAAIKYAWDNFEWFREAVWAVVDFFTDTLVPAFVAAWEWIRVAAENTAKFFMEVVVPAFQSAWEWIKGAAENVVKFFTDTVIPGFMRAWEIIRDAAQAVANFFTQTVVPIFQRAWEIIRGAAEAVASWFMDHIVPVFKNAWGFIQEAAELAIIFWQTVLQPVIEDVWNIIRTVVEGVVNFFINVLFPAFVGAFQLIVDGAQGLVNFFVSRMWPAIQEVWDAIYAFIGPLIEGIIGFIDGIITIGRGVIEFFKGVFTADWTEVWNGIKTFFSGIWQAFQDAVDVALAAIDLAWQTFKAAFSVAWAIAWNSIKFVFTTLWDTMSALVSTILKGIRSAWELFITPFQLAWDTAWALVSTVFTGIWNGIESIAGGVLGAIQTMIDGIVDGINLIKSGLNVLNPFSGPGVTDLLTTRATEQGLTVPGGADGLNVTRRGLVIVGERGPELLNLNAGARVSPLSRPGGTGTSSIPGTTGPGRSRGRGIVINVNLPEGTVISEGELVETIRRELIRVDADGSIGLSVA